MSGNSFGVEVRPRPYGHDSVKGSLWRSLRQFRQCRAGASNCQLPEQNSRS